MDRIDLHVEVTPVNYQELSTADTVERSEQVRERVVMARAIQRERFKDSESIYSNAQVSSKMLTRICKLDVQGAALIKNAMEKLNLSARAYHRILKVSRTIADLAGSSTIQPAHVAESIGYRSLDREGWAVKN
jgi:magnesium chelatase family protein